MFLWIVFFYGNDKNYTVGGKETDHRPLTKWGTKGTGDGEFNEPHTAAFDPAGNAYVTDLGNNRVQKFDSDGNFITKWGTQGTGNGEFLIPEGIDTDSLGRLRS
jgi:tripartite motif-containing protein 71